MKLLRKFSQYVLGNCSLYSCISLYTSLCISLSARVFIMEAKSGSRVGIEAGCVWNVKKVLG